MKQSSASGIPHCVSLRNDQEPLVGIFFSRFILEAGTRIRLSWRVKNWDPRTTPGDVYCDLTIADKQVIVSANT